MGRRGNLSPGSKELEASQSQGHSVDESGVCSGYAGLPRWPSGKESACQCRGHGLDPWLGKISWRRKWQHIPVFLPGKSHGRRSLVDYSPWGRKEVDMSGHACTCFHSQG